MEARESDPLVRKTPENISDIINRMGTGKFQLYLGILGGLLSLIMMIQCTLVGIVAFVVGEAWSLSHLQIAFFTTLNLVGMGIGFLISSIFENTAGRWELCKVGQWLCMIFSVLSSFSPEFYTFTFTRMITATGTFIFLTPSYASISEMLPVDNRGKILGSFEYSMVIGNVLLPAVVYLLDPNLEGDNWRILVSLVAVVPGIPSIALTYYLINDSPIYLSKRNKPNQAIVALDRMAYINNQPPLSAEEKVTVYDKLEKMRGRVSVMKFFRRDQLKHTAFMIILWNVSTLGDAGVLSIYPYLLEIDDNSTGILFGFVLIGVVQFPGITLYLLVIDNQIIGRRYTMVMATLICLAASVVPIFVANEWAVISCASTLVAIKYIMIMICYLYTFELYNTEMRASATNYINILSRFTIIGSPYLFIAMIEAGSRLSFIFLAALEVIMLLSILFLAEETMGKALDDEAIGGED